MRHLRVFEKHETKNGFTYIGLKYRVGEYVKYLFESENMSKVIAIDTTDFIRPYLIEIYKDLYTDRTWSSESNLYTNKETDIYNDSNKFNL